MMKSENEGEEKLKVLGKILLVDDEFGLCEVVKFYLEDSGFDVCVVSNVEDGLGFL